MQVNVLFPINAEAFTYLVPEDIQLKIKIGSRVLAPFRNRDKIGVIQNIEPCLPAGRHKAPSKQPAGKQNTLQTTGGQAEHRAQGTGPGGIQLKTIKAVLDEEPLVPENLLKLIQWVGQYYISTSGLALKNAVPSGVLEGRKSGKSRITCDTEIKKPEALNLTSEQRRSLNEINRAHSGTFLLHGVTGSGKTEVYIRAIKSLPEDREAIVLVPEIAITAQMTDRFRSSFGNDVVFFHSGVSMGEKITCWLKMKNGRVKVVLGVRSAVFAPFKRLGLIVIDEEQEASYKQFEGLRYSARDVALARAKLENAKVILGSATPSLETFYNAETGKFHYIELKHRINQRPLPQVEIINMIEEEKKTWSLSQKLIDTLKENILNRCQSLIMLNRRGYSPFLMCTDCGYTYKCLACSITLTYHKDKKTLDCHYCGSYLRPQNVCPECKGSKMKYVGVGTQRIEEELRTLIPELSLKRMDRDTTRKKLSHYRIVKDMEGKKIDVLLGTQMVAKGHDFPYVTLSAVVSADVALNLPDFRSAERAFQLFTQLAGRAGRGDAPGKAYIQTYEPDHYVFDYVRNHDYKGFYQKEISLRKGLSYPPFSKLVRIIISFRNRQSIQEIIKEISERIRMLTKGTDRKKNYGVEVLGPAPAPIEKIRNLWRWHLILKGGNSKVLRHAAADIVKTIKDIKSIRIDVDVDPINML